MAQFNKRYLLYLVVCTQMFFAACGSQPESATPQPAKIELPKPTATALQISPTPIPSTPTPKPSPSPSPSPTAIPLPDFTNTYIYSVVDLGGGNFMAILDAVPDDLPEFFVITVDEQEYTCETKEDYPARLYCLGSGELAGRSVWVRLFLYEIEEAVWEKEQFFPVAQNNTTASGDSDNQDAGTNTTAPGVVGGNGNAGGNGKGNGGGKGNAGGNGKGKGKGPPP